MRLVIGHRLAFMTEILKRGMNALLRAPGEEIMPHVIAIKLGISRAESLAIIAVLEAEELVESKLLIYHECELGVPAGAIPFGKGFPQLPWTCGLCERSVDTYDELRFDVQARTLVAVEMV